MKGYSSAATAMGRADLGRGVWRCPWRSLAGRDVFVAVDSQGRRVAEAEDSPDELWRLLERIDPARSLTLVRAGVRAARGE